MMALRITWVFLLHVSLASSNLLPQAESDVASRMMNTSKDTFCSRGTSIEQYRGFEFGGDNHNCVR
jgi:hypothetical protein